MEVWSCAACAEDNPTGMVFCGHCGAHDDLERPLTVGTWGCRSCATANADTMHFCGRCGLRRGELRADDLRLVTALFADISGFTTLADQLDAEELHAVINPLIAALAGIAERYDGFVAKYAGDALLCLFGAPIAHEDDAQRALLAAFEMHATLPTLLASLGPAAAGLTIHIGVNTGKVVAGAVGSAAQNDYSVLGDSVILAQRLESVCPSGQTYVGESTRDLCKDEFDFEDVGELQLKGKLHVVRGFRLVGRRRTGTDASRPLVGREAELTAVLSTLERSGAVVLVGEPGVGKSRLLAEARLRATASAMRWLPMRCLSYGASLPYWPFVDLLRQALGLRVEDLPEEVLTRLATSLPPPLVAGAARLLGHAVDELEPEAARRQVHDSLAGMLGVLSGGRPVVMAVEDVHWIDQSSADVLAELIRLPGSTPMGVVLTTRAEGLDRARGLAAESTVSAQIVLEPLGPESVPLVASAVLGSPIAAGVRDLLVERTRGNPLFVEELARSLQEGGALVSTSAGLDLRPGFDVEALPDTVERVFAARVDSLPLPATSVLLIAAVAGRVVRLSLLAAVAQTEDVDLAPLDDLVAAGLLDRVLEQDEPAVTFHHALLHDAVYGRLLKKQRKVIHRTVADAGKTLYGDGDETIDLLARHLYLAEAGDEAATALIRAGQRAARLFANDSAASHLKHAVEVLGGLPGDSRQADVLEALGSVSELNGDYDAALSAYREAADLRDSSVAATGIATVLRKTGEYTLALHHLHEQLERTSPDQSVSLLLERARSLFLSGRPAEALQAVRDGLRVAPDDHARGRLLVELIRNETDVGHPEFAVAHGRRAVELLTRVNDKMALATTHRIVANAHRILGQLDAAATSLEMAVRLADETGNVEERAGALANLGLVRRDQGDLPQSLELTREAISLFERISHASGQGVGLLNLADGLLRSGDIDSARAAAERAMEISQRIGNTRLVGVALFTLGELALAQGQLKTARDQFSSAREVFVRISAGDYLEETDEMLAKVAASSLVATSA